MDIYILLLCTSTYAMYSISVLNLLHEVRGTYSLVHRHILEPERDCMLKMGYLASHSTMFVLAFSPTREGERECVCVCEREREIILLILYLLLALGS